MSDFLTSLTERTLGVAPVVRPRISPMFAPPPTIVEVPAWGALSQTPSVSESSFREAPQPIPGSNISRIYLPDSLVSPDRHHLPLLSLGQFLQRPISAASGRDGLSASEYELSGTALEDTEIGKNQTEPLTGFSLPHSGVDAPETDYSTPMSDLPLSTANEMVESLPPPPSQPQRKSEPGIPPRSTKGLESSVGREQTSKPSESADETEIDISNISLPTPLVSPEQHHVPLLPLGQFLQRSISVESGRDGFSALEDELPGTVLKNTEIGKNQTEPLTGFSSPHSGVDTPDTDNSALLSDSSLSSANEMVESLLPPQSQPQRRLEPEIPPRSARGLESSVGREQTSKPSVPADEDEPSFNPGENEIESLLTKSLPSESDIPTIRNRKNARNRTETAISFNEVAEIPSLISPPISIAPQVGKKTDGGVQEDNVSPSSQLFVDIQAAAASSQPQFELTSQTNELTKTSSTPLVPPLLTATQSSNSVTQKRVQIPPNSQSFQERINAEMTGIRRVQIVTVQPRISATHSLRVTTPPPDDRPFQPTATTSLPDYGPSYDETLQPANTAIANASVLTHLPPARASELSPATIHITIGRIDVRAAKPKPTTVSRPKPRHSNLRLSLNDYLMKRQGGEL